LKLFWDSKNFYKSNSTFATEGMNCGPPHVGKYEEILNPICSIDVISPLSSYRNEYKSLIERYEENEGSIQNEENLPRDNPTPEISNNNTENTKEKKEEMAISDMMMFKLLRRGDPEVIKSILKSLPNKKLRDLVDENNQSLLHVAALSGNREIIEILLQRG
jgi:hypothetical protein